MTVSRNTSFLNWRWGAGKKEREPESEQFEPAADYYLAQNCSRWELRKKTVESFRSEWKTVATLDGAADEATVTAWLRRNI